MSLWLHGTEITGVITSSDFDIPDVDAEYRLAALVGVSTEPPALDPQRGLQEPLAESDNFIHWTPGSRSENRKENASRIPENRWEEMRPIIEHYFYEQGRTLKAVQGHMLHEYSFDAEVHQYKYKLGQWGRKKNSKKVEREGGTPRNAIHQRTRVSKSPIDRKRSVPSRFIFNAIPSLLPQPEIYQPSATVIGSSRNFIYGLFQRDRGKWTWDDHQLRPPTGSHDSSNVWTSLLDKTETTSMLLQVKGGNQTRKAHRSRNPSSEKRESQHQMFQILHQIYADLFDVAKQSTPSTLYGFWQICHQFSGLCSRMKPGIACTHDLSAFLGHLKELFRIVHGLHHPLSHVLDALCSIPSDEEHKLKHIIRLGHEATVRTLEEILPTNHDLVLHLWSRHLKGWGEKRPRDSPFFTKYVQIINESESSTALSDDVRLSRLYEYTFASYYHSDDDELRVRLAHELVQRAFAIRRSTASQLRYDTTCKSIYLATSILGVHYKFVKDTSRLSEVSDAIERLQGGDNECRMRAADLARFLARTYKNFNMSEESSAAYKRFLTIRSSISGVNAY